MQMNLDEIPFFHGFVKKFSLKQYFNEFPCIFITPIVLIRAIFRMIIHFARWFTLNFWAIIHSSRKVAAIFRTIQYCAKVTQAKYVNFVLCSPAFSRKVRVTIQGLLSEISQEQRTIFHDDKHCFTNSVPEISRWTDTTTPHTIYSIYPSYNVRKRYTEGFQRTRKLDFSHEQREWCERKCAKMVPILHSRSEAVCDDWRNQIKSERTPLWCSPGISFRAVPILAIHHRMKCQESADWNFAGTRDNVAGT